MTATATIGGHFVWPRSVIAYVRLARMRQRKGLCVRCSAYERARSAWQDGWCEWCFHEQALADHADAHSY